MLDGMHGDGSWEEAKDLFLLIRDATASGLENDWTQVNILKS